MTKRTVFMVSSACVVASLAIVFARSAYRDSHYWRYDDYRWNCYAAEQDYCVRGAALDRIPHDLPTLLRSANRSPDDADSSKAPADKEPWRHPPKLKLLRVRGDTADIEVVNAFTLTQSMGSTGAAEFIAESVLTLTECPGIRRVNLVFEVGDHATPGRYSRDAVASRWRLRR